MDATTFSIADMFSGIDLPEEQVNFYTDARTGYEIRKADKELAQAELRGDEDEVKRLQALLEELVVKRDKKKFVFTVRDATNDHRRVIKEEIDKKFPPERDFVGNVLPNAEADEEYANQMWALHIPVITDPEGNQIIAPTPEMMRVIRAKAPSPELKKVEAVIQGFASEVERGFEYKAQETDFLSEASPEA